jgi:hypothetical protein
VHGFDAALAAEAGDGVGPIPPAFRDAEVFCLVEEFAAAMKVGDTVAASVAELGIQAHWKQILTGAWDICWDALATIRTLPLAASTRQRWQQDREAYTRHADWQQMGGRRRVRPTVRQAAEMHSKLESADKTLKTQEAIDDPLRMAPYVLRDEAVIGTVVSINPDHVELSARGHRRRYPLVTLETPDRCDIPVGKQLWWTGDPNKERPWVVREVLQPAKPSQLSRITLRRAKAATNQTRLPTLRDQATFSVLHVDDYQQWFPAEAAVPWTHRPLGSGTGGPAQGALDADPVAGEPSATDAAPAGFAVADAANAQGEE